MENLYDVLEVSSKASDEIIEKAYKTLAKKYHPDIAKDKKTVEGMMKKINLAYDVLSDANKRKEYDLKLQNQKDQNQYVQSNIRNNSMNNARNSSQNSTNDSQFIRKIEYVSNLNFFDKVKYYYREIKQLLIKIKNLEPKTRKKIFIFIGIIVVILVCAVMLLINSIKSIFKVENGEKQKSSDNSIVYIEDSEPAQLSINLIEDLKNANFVSINNYCIYSNDDLREKIKKININNALYKKIIDINNFEVIESKITSNYGTVTLEVNRKNYFYAIIQTSLSFMYLEKSEREKEKQKIFLEFVENYANDSETIKIDIEVIKDNQKWKIELNESVLEKILGISINNIIYYMD